MIFSNIKNIEIPEGDVTLISRGSEILWERSKYKQKLMYLESDGKQFLDTEIIGKSGIETFLDFEFISGDLADFIMFGSATTKWASRCYPVAARDANAIKSIESINNVQDDMSVTQVTKAVQNVQWMLGYDGRVFANVAPELGQRYAITSELFSGKQTMTVNGTTIINETNDTAVDTETSMYLFGVHCIHDNTTFKTYGASRIYSSWIKVDGVLVRDLIPVLDWNNVPCMYDNVSEKFFYNKGTGQFSYELI